MGLIAPGTDSDTGQIGNSVEMLVVLAEKLTGQTRVVEYDLLLILILFQ